MTALRRVQVGLWVGAAALLVLSSGSGGCAASEHATSRPSLEDGRARGAATAFTGESAHYGVEPLNQPDGQEWAVLRSALDILTPLGGRPEVSPALCLAARELATRAAQGERDPLATYLVRSALARASAFDPAPRVLLVTGEPREVLDALSARVPHVRATHVGVGVIARGDVAFAVLLVSERMVRLNALPHRVDVGARVALSGELGRGQSGPQVFVKEPAGGVTQVPTSGDAHLFRVKLGFPSAGRYVVEVVAFNAGNPEVAALLPIAAGDASLDAEPPARGDPNGLDVSHSEDLVASAINATRSRNGLSRVDVSRALCEIARRHSEAMLQAGKVSHVLPGSGDLSVRLRRANVPYGHAYENVGRDRSALEAHESAEESPAHLANVLRPGIREMGVGVAWDEAVPKGPGAVYLTEIFLEPSGMESDGPLSPEERVREELWHERERSAAPPLTVDPLLDSLAQETVNSMLASDEPSPGDGRELALRLGHRSVAAVDVFVANAPAEAKRSANLRDPRFRRVGVGVGTGESRRFGAGRLWIAVIYTD